MRDSAACIHTYHESILPVVIFSPSDFHVSSFNSFCNLCSLSDDMGSIVGESLRYHRIERCLLVRYLYFESSLSVKIRARL
jgi:hypothetical protein